MRLHRIIPLKLSQTSIFFCQVITTLLTIEGVVSCSKKLGRLEVSIDDTKDRKTIVEKVKLHLKNESIKATFVDGNFTYFLCFHFAWYIF